MRVPLRTRFSVFLIVSILSISLVSTVLFAWFFRAAAEKEIAARGEALVQSLARAAASGLAAENLDLIAKAADIVQVDDLLFVQVLSAHWSPIDAYPFEELRNVPAPEAVAHFNRVESPFTLRGRGRFDFYAPIRFRIPQAPETIIGYARLSLSAAPLQSSLRSVVLGSVLLGALFAVGFVAVAQVVIGDKVVAPVLALHRAVARFYDGQEPEAPAGAADDEIADLGREFHQMSRTLREREERLSDEKERLAVTLRSIGDGVVVADADGKISLLNRAAEELTGWRTEEAAGRPFCEVLAISMEPGDESCASIVAQVLATGSVVTLPGSTVLQRRDGTRIRIEDSAAPIRDRESNTIGVVLVFRDVTEKRRLELEAAKADKLEALGVLAGGIAHDFNNLLTGILGNISLARARLAPGDPVQERLERAEAATGRAAELAVQLLTFSKGGQPLRRAADVGAIIRESARFALAGTNVKARFDFAAGCRAAEVDAGQINQVFNNLAINAVQAMPRGGTIHFSVANVAVGDGEVAALSAGDYLLITVRDEGAGIDPEHLGRVFDPYFTTKPEGAGLGLTSTYSIVKRHGGYIDVSSTAGQGTTFRIFLPASRGAQVPGAAPAEKGVEAAGRSSGGAVLVMDDELSVLELASELLRSLDYEPVLAKDGREALDVYRRALEQGRPFKAVIMDLTIPGGMGGREAVARLLELDPGARAIVSSGYSNDPILADYRAYGFRGAIVKPYGVRVFARTLQEALDGA